LQIAKLRNGKLICVFGCGGNRDKSKRALMGAIAARLADKIIITSDNPRFEDPNLIMNDILRGIPSADLSKVQTQVDRANAILWSARQSAPEDVVLVAGKGHENSQELEGRKFPFSDQDHICLAIGGLR
jgi:UDP-N-acetylmuramoyl-L-alanyl-D-glutamate--2,6-diaminopimelate ligase